MLIFVIYAIIIKNTNMHLHHQHTAGHPSTVEQDIAVAVVLWLMLAGLCVILANAWALEYFVEA